MVAPKIAFADLKWLLGKCFDDMEFLEKNYEKSCIDSIRMAASTTFERISETGAVELLQGAIKELQKFENKVESGIELACKQERSASFFNE
ncbi:hypothetical protein ACOSQ2_006709 [Xanthoceras sorbifolium]